MATDIRDEVALRAATALLASGVNWSMEEMCNRAFVFAEIFLRESKRQAEKRESELRASLNHD